MSPHPRRPPRPRALPLVAAAALLATATAACGTSDDRNRSTGADGDPAKMSAAPAAGVVAPAKVEVIAGLTGCTADIRIDADELRQGACRTGDTGYLITTFPEERFKETWLDSAAVYGGTYLVGTRWVVSGKTDLLERFRPRLGGEIKELKRIGGDPGGAPSDPPR
ncbi:hypothetical protein ACIQPQ_10110 [Streptomyces sp. NPDC091281]|uniref:hypothetical protein n=1 Tax=Streptomyces sp. NPDC091281 TaxID=3365985 RepID=UPI0037F14847